MKTINLLCILYHFCFFPTDIFYLMFFITGFSTAGLGVVEDPGNISNAHQVQFTKPIVAIVVHNLCKEKTKFISVFIMPSEY